MFRAACLIYLYISVANCETFLQWQSQKLESMLRDFEYAVKSGEILIPRLHWQTVPQAFSEVQGEEQRDTNDMKLKHITVKTPGLLHTMNWTDGKIDDLREGEVLVETKAVGLNFRVGPFPHLRSSRFFSRSMLIANNYV